MNVTETCKCGGSIEVGPSEGLGHRADADQERHRVVEQLRDFRRRHKHCLPTAPAPRANGGQS